MDPVTIMALIGAASSLAGGLSSSKKPKNTYEQIDRFNPQQKDLLGGITKGAAGAMPSGMELIQKYLSGDPSAFRAFEAPYQRQFKEEILPEIGNRYAGMGSGGNLSSSAFQQSLAGAGTALSEKLASLHGGLQMNALDKLQGLAGLGLTPEFETVGSPGDPGFWGSMAPAFGQVGGKMLDYGLGKEQTENTGGGAVAASPDSWWTKLINSFKG